MLNNYICAVDIGSNKISASVARLRRKRIVNLFFETLPAKGVKGGVITDAVELVGCIDRIMKSLKVKSGINIKIVYTNISGQNIITKHSRAILPLAERGNKVITLSDIQRVNEQARILGSSLDDEIIYQEPFGYSIDSKSDITQPLGLYSHRLETDLYLVCAKMSSTQCLSRVINQAGYEIKKLFFSGIVTSKAVFGKEKREGIHIFCDIGSDICELLIFKDGLLRIVEVLTCGGNDLTLSVSNELKIPFDLAEDVKKSNPIIIDQSKPQEDREILIKKDNIYKPIKQKLISDILSHKAKSVCQDIKKTVEKTVACNHARSFVVTGRMSLMEGFLETMENVLGVPVTLGRVVYPEINLLLNKENEISGQKYLAYLTSLGMICEVLQSEQPYFSTAIRPSRNIIVKAVNKVKEVYQEYF